VEPAAARRPRGVPAEVGADDATWARARGWVLLQALAQLAYFGGRNPILVASARHVIAELAAERHRADGPESAES
jgi:aminoglycoside phosphotransferase (APT) family kinase protein